jgi:hypothetical protein
MLNVVLGVVGKIIDAVWDVGFSKMHNILAPLLGIYQNSNFPHSLKLLNQVKIRNK